MNPGLTPADAAWLACAIDSEGSICATRARRRGGSQMIVSPRVMVANTHQGYIDRAATIVSATGATPHVRVGHRGANYPVLRVEVQSQRDVALLLHAVRDWLIIKHERADALLDWIAAREVARRSRPGRGGGTPYGPETDRLLAVFTRKA